MNSFPLGRLCASRGVADRAAENRAFENFIWQCIARYTQRDWGNLSASDKRMNDEAVKNSDGRILASYEQEGQPTWHIWIITEADRSTTTVIFPDEY